MFANRTTSFMRALRRAAAIAKAFAFLEDAPARVSFPAAHVHDRSVLHQRPQRYAAIPRRGGTVPARAHACVTSVANRHAARSRPRAHLREARCPACGGA